MEDRAAIQWKTGLLSNGRPGCYPTEDRAAIQWKKTMGLRKIGDEKAEQAEQTVSVPALNIFLVLELILLHFSRILGTRKCIR
jgi:hypothetical protein